jgi:4'-phosphopantetheinyl transferase
MSAATEEEVVGLGTQIWRWRHMESAAHSGALAAGGTDVSIGRGAVHAWLVDLDAPAAAEATALDADERARVDSYLRPRDGARFAASRAALRLILARYLGCEPGRVEFCSGSRGQPRLARDDVQFSLARSGALALVAVSVGPVGADLERVEPRAGLADVAAARFSAAEAACIAGGCGGSPTQSFYRHWTAKEAYLKATGVGLAGLRDAELVCGQRLSIRLAGQPLTGWSLLLPRIAPGYLAAIASPQRVTRWRWRWLSGGWPANRVSPAGSFR